MAMNYLWADLYGGGSAMNTAQTTIPEAADTNAMPQQEHGAEAAGAIADAGAYKADTKHIFLFMLFILVVAFILGAM